MKTENDISNHNLLEANQGVIKALLAPPGQKFDRPVTRQSAFWQREACTQVRRYLGRECDYGMGMEAGSWSETTEIWPFTETSFAHLEHEDGIETMIGAVCFEKAEYQDIGTIWNMAFCWVHPFHRSQGLLLRKWEHFERVYGKFAVGHPWSKPMKGFLQSVGYPATKQDFIKWAT